MSSAYGSFTVPEFDRATWSVLGLSAVLFLAFSVYTVALYRSYWLTGSDFGSYVHMFATTLSGEGFLLHGKYRVSHPGGSYWGAHFSLTLLVFLPIYALVPRPETLLVAKSFVLAASVPALWLVVRTHLDSDYLAGVVVASYALNPWLWSAWLFDFQEQALLPLLVFVAYYCYLDGRHRAFLAVFALALVTNEFAIIVLVGFLGGLLVAAYRRGRLAERGPVLVAALVLAIIARMLAGVVIDQNSVQSGIPTASVAAPLQPFVEGVRVSVLDLLGVALANPELLWRAAAFDAFQKFAFFVLLLVPVAFLCLTDESTVGALLPFLGFAWLLAGRPIYYIFGAHYPLYLLPVIYVGTARVLERVSVVPPQRTLLVRLFVIAMVLSVAGGITVGIERDVVPRQNPHAETLEAAIETVPREASLVTQNDVYPHVATRPHASFVVWPEMATSYQREYGPIEPEYVLIVPGLASDGVDWSHPVRKVFGSRLGEEYGLYRYEDGIWLFRRGYDGPVTAFTADRRVDHRYDPGAFPDEPAQPDPVRLAFVVPPPTPTNETNTDAESVRPDTRSVRVGDRPTCLVVRTTRLDARP